MGCHFPGGAVNPKRYWQMLMSGQDAIIDVPSNRWDYRRFYDENPEKAGKTYMRRGGFLQEDIYQFDPLFFGISPKEAQEMDPQQCLLLETTWEAIEDAGLIRDELKGSPTGVFIGGFCLDNMLLRVNTLNREITGIHTATSCTMTLLSNRISHVFDLQGPSFTVDTACSSSLVALNSACMSLEKGECDTAIVGGVNIMLKPDNPIMMSKARLLSQHGHSMAFDERAAGYSRGEGAGIVIVKPLEQAIEAGDRIHAVIRATGANQDGHTAGISLPNGDAQYELINRLYEQCLVDPSDVVYVEAHGTGTKAGDPIEINALNRMFGKSPRSEKLWVGSVKSNMGHLEAAAGIAGLIKAILVLKHQKIPKNLHFENANPQIDFQNMQLQIPAQPIDVHRESSKSIYASVNSFGYGGTNAHVIIESADILEKSSTNTELQWPINVPLSANDVSSLRQYAGKLAFKLTLTKTDADFADIVHTLIYRRSHLRARAWIKASSLDDFKQKLKKFSVGENIPGVYTAESPENRQKPVFVFTGMGPQWWRMGRDFFENEPQAREFLEQVDRHFTEISGWSIRDELFKPEGESRMADTEVAQPANFVLQAALAQWMVSQGIEPAAIVGHSVGEVSAAYISGALSLADAIRVSYHRSRLQQTTAGMGVMLAVGLPAEEIAAWIADYGGISVAAINSPQSVTLAGDEAALNALAERLDQAEIFQRFLRVNIPYHSHVMDTIREGVFESLAALKPHQASYRLYSTVHAKPMDGEHWNAGYWWQNVRQPVQFAKTISQMMKDGYDTFIEVGPHPVLRTSIIECAESIDQSIYIQQTLNRKEDEKERLDAIAAEYHVNGGSLQWESLFPKTIGNFTDLPLYAWNHKRHWIETDESTMDRFGLKGHVYLNEKLSGPLPAWQVEINKYFFPYIEDHRVLDKPVFPGAGYVEAGIAYAREELKLQNFEIRDLTLHSMLTAELAQPQKLSVQAGADGKSYSVNSIIRTESDEWEKHAEGHVLEIASNKPMKRAPLDSIQNDYSEEVDMQAFYKQLAKRGLVYRQSYQTVSHLRTNSDGGFWAEFEDPFAGKDSEKTYYVNPRLFDGAIHSVLVHVPGKEAYVPVRMGNVRYYGDNRIQPKFVKGWVEWVSIDVVRADLTLIADNGDILVEVTDALFQRLHLAGVKDADEYLYEENWASFNLLPNEAQEPPSQNWLVIDSSENHEIWKAGLKGASIAKIDCISEPDIESVFENTNAWSHCLWRIPALEQEDSTEKLMDTIANRAAQYSRLVKALQAHREEPLYMTIVASKSLSVNDEAIENLLPNAYLGLTNVAANENAQRLATRYLDIDVKVDHALIQKLVPLLHSNHTGELIALRGDQFLAKHFSRSANEGNEAESVDSPVLRTLKTDERAQLNIQTSSSELTFDLVEKNEYLKAHEVEIQVNATALTYKDLLKVRGRMQALAVVDSYLGDAIGMEVTGIVSRTGAEVTRVKVGDRVLAGTGNTLSNFAVAEESFVFPLPKSIDDVGGLIYTNFLTAQYSLLHLASLKSGDTILIHSATGGVGLAAIEIAKYVGATIFATASSDSKRDYLRELGVDFVFDSTQLDFASEILKHVETGIDVVLNSLPGEFLARSLEITAPGGRFIELGKTDILTGGSLPLSLFNRNIAFHAVDFDRMHIEHPALIQELAAEVLKAFESGDYKPVRTAEYAIAEVNQCLVDMEKRNLIGKAVLSIGESAVFPLSENADKSASDDFIDTQADAAYLITGGTGGFGLETAKWLAGMGAQNLLLMSRSGTSPEAEAWISLQENQTANIRLIKGDICDSSELSRIAQGLKNDGFKVAGIFHAAGVLDDKRIEAMDFSSYQRVIRPKVMGALNLIEVFRDSPPDFMVCYSSVSSLVGNQYQANYAAANALLDGLAMADQHGGTHIVSVNWGAIADAGMVARDKNVEQILAQSGIMPLELSRAFDAMKHALSQRKSSLIAAEVDWQKWAQANQGMAIHHYFRDFLNKIAQTNEISDNETHVFITELLSKPSEERLAYIEESIILLVETTLKLESGSIKPQQNLGDFGIDSITALELSVLFKKDTSITLTAQELARNATPESLSKKILKRLNL